MEETQRQKKIAGIIQRDLADILQRAATDGGLQGTLISISKVFVTVDLSLAKVYVSIFPNKEAQELLDGIKANQVAIRYELAQRTKNQLRRVPELIFYLDDSLDYIDKIEQSLKGDENPIENRDLLDKRKKS
ncbi:30S ribosome-binding factor RbfA [Muricauda sp. JGD-17]|uniref:Ribosome-binding factor A n=1 Tax=Flagellimonas ochracea TaxID=2696472 RepID=A0A964TBB3_9FLAO|nr:30S ribosome-binding factor RbfA [Allomuricauda ochracea]NAY91710.1 30S ribosome-binding factor RbfA [Allomuricauda ochracea]